MSQDFFAEKAANYEQNAARVENVNSIAEAIRSRLRLTPDMHLMDFGAGTGLLLQGIAPFVNKITAVDVSPSMSAQLRSKQPHLACELEVLEIDLTTSDLDSPFDGVISSMTLHHIKDTQGIMNKLCRLIKPGGFIALADLQTEDGSFHQEETGVHHLGFSEHKLLSLATAAGFSDPEVAVVNHIQKPQGNYPVLLLTARRDK